MACSVAAATRQVALRVCCQCHTPTARSPLVGSSSARLWIEPSPWTDGHDHRCVKRSPANSRQSSRNVVEDRRLHRPSCRHVPGFPLRGTSLAARADANPDGNSIRPSAFASRSNGEQSPSILIGATSTFSRKLPSPQPGRLRWELLNVWNSRTRHLNPWHSHQQVECGVCRELLTYAIYQTAMPFLYQPPGPLQAQSHSPQASHTLPAMAQKVGA